jgi:hypothetical protein
MKAFGNISNAFVFICWTNGLPIRVLTNIIVEKLGGKI